MNSNYGLLGFLYVNSMKNSELISKRIPFITQVFLLNVRVLDLHLHSE